MSQGTMLIVEPHPDDVFLSLDWTLRHQYADWSKRILTVYTDDKRGREAEEYAKSLPNCSSVVLGLPETNMQATVAVQPVPELQAWFDSIRPAYVGSGRSLPWDLILFPLGLQHPDHKRIAVSRTPGAWRYMDSPYLAKQKLSEELTRLATGMVLRSIVFPPKNKWNRRTIFKTQGKFFHFNEHLFDSKVPEIIVAPA